MGLVLAAVFAVAFIRGSVRVPLPRFFKVTSAILAVIGAQLLLTGTHELMEAGVLPSSRREMALVGPIVSNDVFFFVFILGLAGWMILRERRQSLVNRALTDLPSAERRLAVAAERRQARWVTAAYSGAFLALILISGQYVYAASARAMAPATRLTAHAGWVLLPAEQAANGQMHLYRVTTPAGTVRFFAIRRPDGSVAVALDACTICGAKGYYQRGSVLYCRNCNAPINVASVGMSGGCNPIPLQVVQHQGVLAVRLAQLTRNAPRFHQ